MKTIEAQRQNLAKLLQINGWTPQEYYNSNRKNLLHHLRDILRPGFISSLDYDYAIGELKEMHLLECCYGIVRQGQKRF